VIFLYFLIAFDRYETKINDLSVYNETKCNTTVFNRVLTEILVIG
jgi:hypothetical protein